MSSDRLKNTADAGRRDRAMEDRDVTERIDLSDDQRVAMFQQSFHEAILPNIPRIEGYHVCWLSTTHPSDSIQRRFQMGYEPIKASEVPGWEHYSQKTGEFAGFLAVQEMLACKIRIDLYQRFMKAVHHDAPRAEEQRMADVADMIRDRLAEGSDKDDRIQLFEGDGLTELRRPAPRPAFE